MCFRFCLSEFYPDLEEGELADRKAGNDGIVSWRNKRTKTNNSKLL